MFQSKLIRLGSYNYVSLFDIKGFHVDVNEIIVYSSTEQYISVLKDHEDYPKILKLLDIMQSVKYVINVDEVVSVFEGIKSVQQEQNNLNLGGVGSNFMNENQKALAIQNLKELIAKRMMEEKEKEKEGN